MLYYPDKKLKETFQNNNLVNDYTDIVSDNILNYQSWITKNIKKGRARSINANSFDEQLDILRNKLNTITPAITAGYVADPYDIDKTFMNLPQLGSITKGYFVALYNPETAFRQECSYNFVNKKIGIFDRSTYLFTNALINGHRIPRSIVSIDYVPLQNWDSLDKLLNDKTFDVMIAYIIPNSAFSQLIQIQKVSVVGFKNIDIHRVRAYYPYVSMEQINLEDFFGKNANTGVMIMAKEKITSCPSMQMKVVQIRGLNMPVQEDFVTRYEWSKEAIDPSYRCYGDLSIENKALCDSDFDVIGLPKLRKTVWDQPCTKNEDCPFYKKNTLYPNERGKCLSGGICEFPVGIKRIAYRKYDDRGVNAPFCYNCEDPLDPDCCDKQIDKDYVFPNDYEERKKLNMETSLHMV